MDANQPKSNKMLVIGSIVILALIAGIATWAMMGSKETTEPTANTNTNTATTQNNRYKNGTYTAEGNYTSPAGAEAVAVSVTISNDVITSAAFQGKASHPTSQKLQGMFSEGYRQLVVGKSIDEVNLGVVNGSSLAPKGFMDALAKIKLEAAA